MATCSMRSMSWLYVSFLVSIPDLRKLVPSLCASRKREASRS